MLYFTFVMAERLKNKSASCVKLKEVCWMNNEFIMKPKVDFCFKELMEDEFVRKGFISAILHMDSKEIVRTELLPTH